MKPFILCVGMFVLVLVSCKKDNNADAPSTTTPPVVQAPQFEDIIGKYLICDSIVLRFPGAPLKGILGKGKGEDIRIRADGKYVQYYIGGPGEIYYQYKKPDTLYLWGEGQVLMPGIYHILKVTAKNKVVKYENKTKEVYYTVEE